MNIWLVGGDKVIPTSVEKAIEGDGYTVKRISGEDRYETAAAIAEAGIKLSGKKPSKVFVASGTSFADALSVSPVAFAKGYPIILTEKDSTSDFSKKELGNIGTDAKILVGGEAVVSKAVAANLSIKEDARVAGEDRAATANLVSDWAKKSEGFNPANAALVGGTNGNGADSLVAASLGGKSLTTLHFAGWDATSVYFKDHAAELTGKGFVFGGKAAVSDDQVGKAQSAAQTAVSNQSISVTTDAKAIATVSSAKSGEENRGAVTYTVMTGADSINIALFDASAVDTSGSVATFTGATKTTDTTAKVAIESVNGAALVTAGSGTTAQDVVVAKPVNGKVVFTVDARVAGQYVPVVWTDGKTGLAKSLDFAKAPSAAAPQTPTEAFGVGQVQRWIPADSDGSFTSAVSEEITFVNKSEKYFTTDDATYHYDDNDRFTVTDSTPRGLDYFEARLTKGDTIDIAVGGYAPTKAQVSSFTLTNGAPVALATPTVETKDTTAVVSFNSTAGTHELVKGAQVKVYLQAQGVGVTKDFKEATAVATVTKDSDSTVDDFQIPLSGLKVNTEYALWITQVVDGEESNETPITGGGTFTTLKDVADLSVKSVSVTDDVNDGVNPTPTTKATALTVKLSGKVAENTLGGFTGADIKVYPTGQPENAIAVTSAAISAAPNEDLVTIVLTDGVNDATTDVEYTIEIASNQLTPKADTSKVNAKLTGTFKH